MLHTPNILMKLKGIVVHMFIIDGVLKQRWHWRQGEWKIYSFRLEKEQLCMCITLFLYISLPSSHNHDMNVPNFINNILFFFLWLDSQSFRIEWDGIRPMKFESAWNNSLLKWGFRCSCYHGRSCYMWRFATTIFSATQNCSVGTMLQLFKQCCNTLLS